jgi:hypothetical protein
MVAIRPSWTNEVRTANGLSHRTTGWVLLEQVGHGTGLTTGRWDEGCNARPASARGNRHSCQATVARAGWWIALEPSRRWARERLPVRFFSTGAVCCRREDRQSALDRRGGSRHAGAEIALRTCRLVLARAPSLSQKIAGQPWISRELRHCRRRRNASRPCERPPARLRGQGWTPSVVTQGGMACMAAEAWT